MQDWWVCSLKGSVVLFQLCVSKCPDRFATLLDSWNTNSWEYYKQFCRPGFDISSKVRDRCPLSEVLFVFIQTRFDLIILPSLLLPSQSVVEAIQDEDCPSMIVPSRPCKWIWITVITTAAHYLLARPLKKCASVLQRCFPDFITRNGILTVANKTIFKDGENHERSVNDLKDAAK